MVTLLPKRESSRCLFSVGKSPTLFDHKDIIKTYFNRKSAPSRFNFAFSAHRLELGGAFGDLATR